jgi:hypothetical protein
MKLFLLTNFTYFGIIPKFCSWFFFLHNKTNQNSTVSQYIDPFIGSNHESNGFCFEILKWKEHRDVWSKVWTGTFIICLVFTIPSFGWAFVAPTMLWRFGTPSHLEWWMIGLDHCRFFMCLQNASLPPPTIFFPPFYGIIGTQKKKCKHFYFVNMASEYTTKIINWSKSLHIIMRQSLMRNGESVITQSSHLVSLKNTSKT